MTATPVRHDGFHKAMVLKATAPFGRGEEEHPIERGAYFADIWFEPTKPPATIPPHLGFWSEIARTPALVESCRSTPPPVRMTDIVARTLNKEHALRHHRDKVAAVRTWVITHGRPLSALEAWGARPHTQADWPEAGVWRLASHIPIFVLVCRDLPETPQTLLFRLMGARNTLRRTLLEQWSGQFFQAPDATMTGPGMTGSNKVQLSSHANMAQTRARHCRPRSHRA